LLLICVPLSSICVRDCVNAISILQFARVDQASQRVMITQ
jgi:hypothetical protein